MKQKFTLLYAAAILLALASCKTAAKLYDKGDYEEAVELAARKLQKNPQDAELRLVLQNAYHYAVNDRENRVRNHHQSKQELRFEWIYQEYAALQKLYDAIYRVPSVFETLQPRDYSGFLTSFADKAGEVRYDRGLAFMQRSGKESYRQAYQEFRAALRFKPGDREITERLNEAWDYAVTRIVIMPLEQTGGFLFSSQVNSANRLDEQLLRGLQLSSGNEFVQFYSAWDARSRQLQPDMLVDLQLSTLHLGRYRDVNSHRRVSKEVVVKETVYRPDSVVKEYARVFADITHTRRSSLSDAVLRVTVRDAGHLLIWNELFASDYAWHSEFASFTGDARALSEADRQQINRRPEFPPHDNEILRCLLEEIGNNAVYRIRSFVNRY